MKILFLVPYPLKESPSQRFRFEQYFGSLTEAGFTYHVQSFLDTHNWQYFFRPGQPLRKTVALIKGFLKRLAILFQVSAYDWIYIHREATPVGPPFFEWIIRYAFNIKIIYDFDDAIWLTDRKDESAFLRIVKWRSKVSSICRWSHKVSAGNDYLCNFARKFTKDVVYNPTTIDTKYLHNPGLYNPAKDSNKVVIGWTGSHSTLKFLKTIEKELIEIEKKHPEVELLVIADHRPDLKLKNFRFLPWSFHTEINGLLESDIGIMPLPDDEWAKGKCGFKALQYMALEIPAVVSPVGVNTRIVDHGENGFLCSTSTDWISDLHKLITDKNLRHEMGKKGRQKVMDEFSVRSNTQNFVSLFS